VTPNAKRGPGKGLDHNCDTPEYTSTANNQHSEGSVATDPSNFGRELFVEVPPKKQTKYKHERWPTATVAHITTPTNARTVAEAVATGTDIMAACGRYGFPLLPMPDTFNVCVDCQRLIRQGRPA
jgi:hypothetical protein